MKLDNKILLTGFLLSLVLLAFLTFKIMPFLSIVAYNFNALNR